MNQSLRQNIAFLGTGIALGVVVLGIAASPGNPLLYAHQACVRGSIVTQQPFLTPYVITNVPYLGWVNYTAFWSQAPGEEIRATGSTNWTSGEFLLYNWSLYRSITTYDIGPGPSAGCTSPYLTSSTPAVGYGRGGALWPPTPSDTNFPSNFTFANKSLGFNETSVNFDIGYHEDNYGSINTCGKPAAHLDLFTTSLEIGLPFRLANHTSVIHAAYPVQLYLNYTFYADSGTWLVDNLDLGVGAPGTGIATLWSHC